MLRHRQRVRFPGERGQPYFCRRWEVREPAPPPDLKTAEKFSKSINRPQKFFSYKVGLVTPAACSSKGMPRWRRTGAEYCEIEEIPTAIEIELICVDLSQTYRLKSARTVRVIPPRHLDLAEKPRAIIHLRGHMRGYSLRNAMTGLTFVARRAGT